MYYGRIWFRWGRGGGEGGNDDNGLISDFHLFLGNWKGSHKDKTETTCLMLFRSTITGLLLRFCFCLICFWRSEKSFFLFRNISVLNTFFVLLDLHRLSCYCCCFCLKNRSILFILEKYRNITRLCCGEKHGLLWKCCMSEKALWGKNDYCGLAFSWIIIISSPPSSHVVELIP